MTPPDPVPFTTRVCEDCGAEVINREPYTEIHAERCPGKPADAPSAP